MSKQTNNSLKLNGQLLTAAENGDLEMIKNLHQNGADLGVDNNFTLKLATYNGHLPVVEYLHQNGVDITADDNCAIKLANKNHHFQIVNYLYKNGARMPPATNNWAKEYSLLEDSYKHMCEYLIKATTYSMDDQYKYICNELGHATKFTDEELKEIFKQCK